jgi:toxin ParE1/3/4
VKHRVSLVEAAEQDLYELHLFVESNDSEERADALLDRLERAVAGLAEIPERGHFPPELTRIGVHEYREIHYKPYRIIYAIHGDTVFVHCILDGRRDMQSLLEQRLLR